MAPDPATFFAAYRISRLRVCLGLAVLVACGGRDPLYRVLDPPDVSHRSVPGRLSFPTAHHPFSRVESTQLCTAPFNVTADPELREALFRAERQSRRRDTTASVARLGILRLAICRYDDAVAQLTAAAARAPDDANVHNDLAVAYLTRSLVEERAFDQILALDAVERAAALSPADPVVRFNRALVLTSFPLPRQAISAWKEYLEIAEDDDWRAEGAEHLAALRVPDRLGRWRQIEARLDRRELPIDTEEIRATVHDFPYRARLYGEETLLARWAAATEANDPAGASHALDVARAIGTALAAERGEHLLADAIAVIERRTGAASPPPTDLVEGLKSFSEGLREYEHNRIESATRPLALAQRRLHAVESPIALWADFYQAVCVYYSDADLALEIFRELARTVDPERYPALFGRVYWLMGTIAGVQGREQEGFDNYRIALEHLQESSGVVGSAFVHVLFAEAYDPLGEVEMGWQHRLEALRGLTLSGEKRRIHSTLIEAAQALLHEGRPELARPFLEELVTAARDWRDHPIALAEALAQRGSNRSALGETASALEDLGRAREILGELEPSGLTEWLGNWIEIYEGQAHVGDDPGLAVELLTTAFDRQSTAGYRYGRSHLLSDRARAYLSLGERGLAEADLRASIAFYERTRDDVADAALKLRYFRQAQPAFEQLLALELQGKASAAAALAIAERARSRFLLDLRRGPRPPVASFPQSPTGTLADDVRRILPPATCLVEYALVPGELLAWVIDRENLRLVRLPLQAERLETDVEKLRRELQRTAPQEAVRTAAATLYDQLIAPLSLPADLGELIVVPDRFLANVPYGALFDRQEGEYLIERFPITIAPSATLLLVAHSGHPGRPAHPAPRALVVGAPGLRGALEEARRVAELYREHELLLDGDATRTDFLASLRQADIVHFAGHAFANSELPQRSTLVFAPDNDDGLLRAEELWSRDFTGIELVVLSACETMVGHGAGREALFGMAGGFFAAGVPKVVATLWKTDDRASTEVMTRFHASYVRERSAERALRAAVVELLQEKDDDLGAPAGWAAFTVLSGSLD